MPSGSRRYLGWIDVLATPAGTESYDDLARTADTFQLFGHRVLIAAVDDLIRMSRAAGRPKDLLASKTLEPCGRRSTGLSDSHPWSRPALRKPA